MKSFMKTNRTSLVIDSHMIGIFIHDVYFFTFFLFRKFFIKMMIKDFKHSLKL